jgi:hypothetical protein
VRQAQKLPNPAYVPDERRANGSVPTGEQMSLG